MESDALNRYLKHTAEIKQLLTKTRVFKLQSQKLVFVYKFLSRVALPANRSAKSDIYVCVLVSLPLPGLDVAASTMICHKCRSMPDSVVLRT